MLPDYLGYVRSQPWVLGQTDTVNISYQDPLTMDKPITGRDLCTELNDQRSISRRAALYNQWLGSTDSIDVSIEDIKAEPEYEVLSMKFFPNPADNYFDVEFNEDQV